MITFDRLVNELIKNGYDIDEHFKVPDNIPLITEGNKVVYLTKGKEIPIIFCKTGFPDRCVIALVGDINHIIVPLDSFTIIEKINNEIVHKTLRNNGVTIFK